MQPVNGLHVPEAELSAARAQATLNRTAPLGLVLLQRERARHSLSTGSEASREWAQGLRPQAAGRL